MSDCLWLKYGSMKRFLVYGTHPELSLAETRAFLGDLQIDLIETAALLEPENFDGFAVQNRLAGIVKLGDVMIESPVSELTAATLADLIEKLPRGNRILFGMSFYGGTNADRKALKNLPIELKRELQSREKSVRWITGDNGEIAPAAISKMHLISEGYDLNIVIKNKIAFVGLTTQIQNIDSWSERDFGRPFRDAKTGMLPPKLARMMVNLAQPKNTLLDPFCGGGTVAMEAGMMFPDLKIISSDIDAKQVSGAERNNEWLIAHGFLKTADKERLTWLVSPAQNIDSKVDASIDTIVTEGFLGKPLSGNETKEDLEKNKREVEAVWKQTLPTLAKIQPVGGRLVCIWPTMKSKFGSVTVDPMADADTAGYKLLKQLSYARPDQNIRRNIVILEKE